MARERGHRYVLVCYDSFDRARGDDDLGNYYVMLNTAAAVRQYLANHQLRLGRMDYPGDAASALNDVCEAVVDLEVASPELTHADCMEPQRWQADNPPDPPPS